MADQAPMETTNLDRYGNDALSWSQAHDRLVAAMQPPWPGPAFFLGTVRPDGRPHSASVGPVWHDGDIYFTSGPETRKSRNLDANPACTVSVQLEGIDLVLEGTAERVADRPTLEVVTELLRAGGWPADLEGDVITAPFSAPSAGPPPWHVYRFTFHTAFGVATAEPNGATRWSFDR